MTEHGTPADPMPPPAGTQPAGAAGYEPAAPPTYPTASQGTAWPEGWGTPPPAWTPPQPSGPPERPRRSPVGVILATTGVLAIGLAGGAAIVLVRDHNESSNPAGASIAVDNSPLNNVASALTGNDAVRVGKQLGPAVGTIVVNSGSNSGGASALGSGFVVSNSGDTSYLVTNNHVVSGANDVRVLMPDGKNLQGTVVGTDQLDDLAVVSVKDGKLPTAVFGQSSQLTVGEEVIAIGSPLGNQGTVTSGVVSALHRSISAGSGAGGTSEQLQDVLQTDAPINPGNSGGPLADAEGRVVGVNVATAGQSTNIGFSIPSDVASRVVQSLIQGHQFKHPFIGIATEDQLTATQDGTPFNGPGVLVTNVSNSSPASAAGIQKGDIITTMDGTSLDPGQTVGGVLQRHNVGDTISMAIKRGNQTLTVNVTLVARPDGI
jgi:S1-C subfamily serine protease